MNMFLKENIKPMATAPIPDYPDSLLCVVHTDDEPPLLKVELLRFIDGKWRNDTPWPENPVGWFALVSFEELNELDPSWRTEV